MLPRFALAPVLCILASLPACGSSANHDRIGIAFIDEPGSLVRSGLRLTPAGQQARAAIAEGLVALDAQGEIVPALAERWIVTDDGLSYIFRLRNSDWPDGSALDGETVRDSLRKTVSQLSGTSLGLDLAPVSEIRAMTGRVVEIRLKSPMPDFLRLLAQPELGILHRGKGAGPMETTRKKNALRFSPLPPEARGLPANPQWAARSRVLDVYALPAARAVAAFEAGSAQLVLNGRLSDLPLVSTGPLSRGTVRLDAAQGLFGLVVRRADGLLKDPVRREAIAMAIERDNLLEPFSIGGWTPTTRVVAPGLAADPGTLGERWQGLTIEQRRAEAARRVAAFTGGRQPVRLSVSLPAGPGSERLLRQLAEDLAPIGVELVAARTDERGDLELIDRLARYGDARWYLNQLNCSLNPSFCSPAADARVREALDAPGPLERAALLAEAEAELTSLNMYIPLGAPVRWSLVRGDIDGFADNRWGLHPLFPLSLRPI